jgi:hypothetical protein
MPDKLITFTHEGVQKALNPNWKRQLPDETDAEFLDRIAAKDLPAGASDVQYVDISAYVPPPPPRAIDWPGNERERLRLEAKSLEEAGDHLGAMQLRLKALET